MTSLEVTIALAFTSAVALTTLELSELVESKAVAYNDAVKSQTDCYKVKDFKCLVAYDKFKQIVER